MNDLIGDDGRVKFVAEFVPNLTEADEISQKE